MGESGQKGRVASKGHTMREIRCGQLMRPLLGASSVALLATLAAAPMQAQNRSEAITYAKDIAPIFQEKCEICHRAEGMAPMSLATYNDVRPWLRSINARSKDATCRHGTWTRPSVSRSLRTTGRCPITRST